MQTGTEDGHELNSELSSLKKLEAHDSEEYSNLVQEAQRAEDRMQKAEAQEKKAEGTEIHLECSCRPIYSFTMGHEVVERGTSMSNIWDSAGKDGILFIAYLGSESLLCVLSRFVLKL